MRARFEERWMTSRLVCFPLLSFRLLGDIWLVLYHVETCKFAGRFCIRLGAVTWGPSKETHITAPQGAGEEENPECRAAGCTASLFSTHLSLFLSLSLFTLLL